MPFDTMKFFEDNIPSDQTVKPTIMIIDDDKTVRDSLRLLLRDHYNVILCSSGQEGIDAITPDVQAVILDIKMEHLDGFETCDLLYQKFPEVPVIFHTAYQEFKDPFFIMYQHRPFAYLKKGYTKEELFDIVERAVAFKNIREKKA